MKICRLNSTLVTDGLPPTPDQPARAIDSTDNPKQLPQNRNQICRLNLTLVADGLPPAADQPGPVRTAPLSLCHSS